MMIRMSRFAAAAAVVFLMSAGPAVEDLRAQGPGGPAPVRTTVALGLDLERSVRLTGSIESRRSSVVASEVEGLVQQLVARDGDRVEKGATLVRLRQSNTALRLQAVQGQLKEAEARQRLAMASLERSEGLFEEKIISRQMLDDAVSEYEAWQGRVAQLQADVSRLEDDLSRTTVRAPFAGVVVEEHIAEGEWLNAGGAVVELVDFEDLEVTVDVPESYFSGVRVDGAALVRIDSLEGIEVVGRIRAIVPRASFPGTGLPGESRDLEPGRPNRGRHARHRGAAGRRSGSVGGRTEGCGRQPGQSANRAAGRGREPGRTGRREGRLVPGRLGCGRR